MASKRYTGLVLSLVVAAGIGFAAWRQYPELHERQLRAAPSERLLSEAAAHPEDAPLQLEAARRLKALGRVEDALLTGRAAVRAAPNNSDILSGFGDLALSVASEQEGLSALQRAIEVDPRCASAEFALGTHFAKLQSSHGAVDHFRRYTQLRPRSPRGWVALAREFLELDESGNALDAATHALAVSPNDAEALAAAGEASKRLGKLPEAEALFRRWSARAPSDARALTGLGSVLLEQARSSEAVQEAQKVLEQAKALAPRDPATRYALGQAFSQQGKWAEAAGEWEAAVKEMAGDQRSRLALSQAYEHLHRPAEAALQRVLFEKERKYQDQVNGLMRQLRQAADPAKLQFALAKLHLQFDHPYEAAVALRAGLATDPNNAWAQQTLSHLQVRGPGAGSR